MMRKTLLLGFVLALFCFESSAQTQNDINLDDFFDESEQDSIQLLPSRMIFTQRLLWGEKGLMRNFDYFELTADKRQRELTLRRNILGAHQILGFATLGGMPGQAYVGAQLYKTGNYRGLHEGLAAYVNATYFTTAGLALFAPPKMLSEGRGYSNMKLHKSLAIVHLSAMIATNLLAGPAADNPSLKPYHRAAAFTAFGAYSLSIIAVKF